MCRQNPIYRSRPETFLLPKKSHTYSAHKNTFQPCYQLLQSVLKIGFALANKCGVAGGVIGGGGIGGGGIGKVSKFQHRILCTWQLPWLTVEQCWLALAGPLLSHLVRKNRRRNQSSSLLGYHFWICM